MAQELDQKDQHAVATQGRQCAETSATIGKEQHSAARLTAKSCNHAIIHAACHAEIDDQIHAFRIVACSIGGIADVGN